MAENGRIDDAFFDDIGTPKDKVGAKDGQHDSTDRATLFLSDARVLERQQRLDDAVAAAALTAANAQKRQVAKAARAAEEEASVPRLLGLYRGSVHSYSLEKVETSDKSVGACIAVLKHHFKVTESALKGKKHPELKELLGAKLREEKVVAEKAVAEKAAVVAAAVPSPSKRARRGGLRAGGGLTLPAI